MSFACIHRVVFHHCKSANYGGGFAAYDTVTANRVCCQYCSSTIYGQAFYAQGCSMKLISVYYCPGQGDSSFDDCCTFNTPNCSLNNINCSSCYLSGSGSVFQFYPNANADISFFSVTQCSGACWAEVYETQPTTVFRHGNINSIHCAHSFLLFSQTVTMDDCYITGITGSLKLTVQGGSLIITNSVIDPWLAPCAKNSKTSGPSHTVHLLNTADCNAVYFPTDEFSEGRAGKVIEVLLSLSLLINQ